MLSYYSCVALISCFSLGILCLLVHDNSRLGRKTKSMFYITYIIILVAFVSEWAAIMLNGTDSSTRALHIAVKCLDYIATPATGMCFISQISRNNKPPKHIHAILSVNCVFQIISAFTGWTFYLDAENYYHHGPLYPVYAAIYILVIVLTVFEFIRYGRKFRRQNITSLIAISLLVISGILIQELMDLRTGYLAVVLACILLFVYYNEFSQLSSDEHIQLQKKLLETDALTNLFSRYSYTELLRENYVSGSILADTVVFSIDINGLKTTNDTLGHLAGDELIKGAAECISSVLSPFGRCFRTGGDEFIAVINTDAASVSSLKASLYDVMTQWHGIIVPSLSYSVGYSIAAEHPDIVYIEKLVALADEEMYSDKDSYYDSIGAVNQRR